MLNKLWRAAVTGQQTKSDEPAPSSPPSPNPWTRPYLPVATTDDILACFRLLLGRLPNQEEWAGHSSRAGQPLPSVVASYLNSLEFSQRGLLLQDNLGDAELAQLPGFSLYASASDAAVGRQIVYAATTDAALGIHLKSNDYEADVTEVFHRILKPGMAVLDIGANIGYFTMLSASIVGARGYVMAIEPNPRNTRLLEASRRANGFDHVMVSQVAAAPETGLLVLHRSHSNGTTSALPNDLNAMLGAELVPCARPDVLVDAARRIDLIKVDVEGAEYRALLGCTCIIQRDHPIIVSEFSPDLMPGISGIEGPDYLRWLVSLGYKLSVIEPDGAVQSPHLDIDLVMTTYLRRAMDHIDIVASHGDLLP